MNAITKKFNDQPVEFIEKDGELWLTGEQIGKALGYKDPRHGVLKVYNRNKKVLDCFKGVVNLTTPGGKQDITVFNEIGVNIIAMKSNTPRANKFIVWAAGIIKEYRHNNLQNPITLPRWITVKDAAELVGQNERTIRRHCTRGTYKIKKCKSKRGKSSYLIDVFSMGLDAVKSLQQAVIEGKVYGIAPETETETEEKKAKVPSANQIREIRETLGKRTARTWLMRELNLREPIYNQMNQGIEEEKKAIEFDDDEFSKPVRFKK